MRILQLTAHFSPNLGGVETHLDDLVSALIKRNHEVAVLTYRPLISKVPWKVHESKKGMEIFRLPWFPGLFYKLTNNPLLEFLYLVPFLFMVCPLILFLKNIEVIHAHGLIGSFTAVFWGKLFRKRVISTTHSIYSFPEKGIYRTFVKWIFQNSSVVLTLSKQSKKETEALGIQKDKVRVFTYWVDLNNFKSTKNRSLIRKKLGIKNNFTVLFVGRLVEEKGIDILLEAARRWEKGTVLVIAGDGPRAVAVKKASESNRSIKYVGRLDKKQLPEYYSLADLTIVPSPSEEGFGRVIIESLACGTPVMGADRGGIPEAIDDSVGQLVEPTAVDIVREVMYLKRAKNALNKLSKNTRRYALKKYSEENVETIIKAYKN